MFLWLMQFWCIWNKGITGVKHRDGFHMQYFSSTWTSFVFLMSYVWMNKRYVSLTVITWYLRLSCYILHPASSQISSGNPTKALLPTEGSVKAGGTTMRAPLFVRFTIYNMKMSEQVKVDGQVYSAQVSIHFTFLVHVPYGGSCYRLAFVDSYSQTMNCLWRQIFLRCLLLFAPLCSATVQSSNVQVSIWICIKFHTLTDISRLNKPDCFHQHPWIIQRINENVEKRPVS